MTDTESSGPKQLPAKLLTLRIRSRLFALPASAYSPTALYPAVQQIIQATPRHTVRAIAVRVPEALQHALCQYLGSESQGH